MRPMVLLCGLAVLMPWMAWSADQTGPTAPGLQNELEAARSRGALLFQIHCAACHGLEGRGNGPLAADLKVAPADLTDLMESDESGDTVFPARRLTGVIDGREDLRGHGAREMPIWGLSFQEPGRDADQEEPVRRRIDDLLAFLRTIQKPGTEVGDQVED
ncbi:MAG: c-type cytochrome [Thermoanaerobaculia bacterium]